MQDTQKQTFLVFFEAQSHLFFDLFCDEMCVSIFKLVQNAAILSFSPIFRKIFFTNLVNRNILFKIVLYNRMEYCLNKKGSKS